MPVPSNVSKLVVAVVPNRMNIMMILSMTQMMGLFSCLMLDKNPSVFISMVLLTNLLAAEKSVSMSVGDPQNCMDPLPNMRKELFLLTDMDGLIDIFVDPWEVMDMVTPKDPTMLSE